MMYTLQKLNSIRICLMAHPDNEPNSEFADRISDLDEVISVIKSISNPLEVAHTEGVLQGLRICKELWAQGTISHETIRENEIYYSEELELLKNPN